ncbi:restriction endonuclease subunit S [Ligilactobacillus salivarius]|uniref:restriction endonuclease subunit S n=1 Tax=Ligilactobacillus salivarius TaxID=1624 RepID=UPI0024B9205E|nr:restriction endonuclease subunit S [Ligilactobacillus salivarius]WHS14640.1 restriction endonuclease subunit S [Ligilactobacillus salivarius]WHS22095.1 restriction endonuclease subunit S [Ligilactobacillus salivarius]
MAKEEKKAPKLRFNGYTNDWERKKLGDVANSYINGGTPDTQNKNYWIGDIPWIQSSDLKNDDIWNVNINKYITNKAVNDSAAKLIPANSIAIVTRVGVGKLAYMSQEYSTSQDFLSLVDIKEDLIFIMYMLYFKISKLSSSLQGTSIKGITKKELLNLSISIVNNTAEQNRIGRVFKILDNSINLHERKCEELALIKKALLQKLFPKKDEIKPEVRYENFSDAWEQRKLGEVVEMFNGDRGYNYPKDSELISEGIPFINAGDLKNGQIDLKNCKKISREKFNQLSGAKIRQGDILYCLRGTLGKNAIVKFNEGTVASSLVDIRPKTINGIYLFIILNSDIEYRQRILNDEGAAQPNLSVRNLAKFIIPVPKTKEQQKIGDFFNQIDTLITLHQCKLKKLRQLKKFLLQNMFI